MEAYSSLGALLDTLMRRAGLSGSALARRLGKSRYTIGRWRKAGARLSEDDLTKLRQALRYVENGAVKDLSEREVLQLRIQGRCLNEVMSSQSDDHSELVDRCIVYSYSYAPHAFPTRWSRRRGEVERETAGSIYLMADYLAPATRPADFYEQSFHRQQYDCDLVEAYGEEWRDYLEFFVHERLDDVVVQHIYERRGLQAYASGKSGDWRDRAVPKAVRIQQLQTLISWIEGSRIEVALTDRCVPACFKIVGHDTVLVEFTQGSRFLRRSNLLGMEIRGTAAVQQFRNQFDSMWKSAETERDQSRVAQELRQQLAAVT